MELVVEASCQRNFPWLGTEYMHMYLDRFPSCLLPRLGQQSAKNECDPYSLFAEACPSCLSTDEEKAQVHTIELRNKV